MCVWKLNVLECQMGSLGKLHSPVLDGAVIICVIKSVCLQP